MQKEKVVKKAATTHISDDVKRYFVSLSEDFQHKVAAIGEHVVGLDEKMNRRHEQTAEMFAHLSQKIDRVDRTTQTTQSDVTDIKGSLKKKVDYDEFQALSRRVAALERSRR